MYSKMSWTDQYNWGLLNCNNSTQDLQFHISYLIGVDWQSVVKLGTYNLHVRRERLMVIEGRVALWEQLICCMHWWRIYLFVQVRQLFCQRDGRWQTNQPGPVRYSRAGGLRQTSSTLIPTDCKYSAVTVSWAKYMCILMYLVVAGCNFSFQISRWYYHYLLAYHMTRLQGKVCLPSLCQLDGSS